MRSFLRPHTRFMLAFWPGLLAFLLLLRLFLAATESLAPLNNIWQKSRIRQGLAAISSGEIGGKGSSGTVVMLGASEALLAFQPEKFDQAAARRGAATRSFNLAFQNTGTMLPLYFSRVRREMAKAGSRARVIFVSVPVPRLTMRARNTFFSQARYHDIDSVFFEPELWTEARMHWGDKLILLFNKWGLGERSLVQLQRTFVQLGRRLVQGSYTVRGSAAPFYREEIHPEPAWNPAARGGYYLNIERRPDLAAEVIAAALEPRAMADDLTDLIRCCDLLELRLDEEHLLEVAAAIASLRAVSDHVVIVSYPESPQIKRRPEAEERSRAAIARLAAESGAYHWNAAAAGFTDSDYFDLSHLTPSGVAKFNEFLAQRLPPAWVGLEKK